MTDGLLQKLEEKVMSLLTEIENLNQEVSQLKQENSSLKSEKMGSSKKLQELISLLGSIEMSSSHQPINELSILQGKSDS